MNYGALRPEYGEPARAEADALAEAPWRAWCVHTTRAHGHDDRLSEAQGRTGQLGHGPTRWTSSAQRGGSRASGQDEAGGNANFATRERWPCSLQEAETGAGAGTTLRQTRGASTMLVTLVRGALRRYRFEVQVAGVGIAR